jgi:hypothetical protein
MYRTISDSGREEEGVAGLSVSLSTLRGIEMMGLVHPNKY